MSWSSRRRTIYFLFFVSFAVMLLLAFYYLFLYKAPTCTDGIQNQDEQDIDCGGVCPTICQFEAVDPIVRWARFFKVKDGIYNVVALVENPNSDVEAYDVPYSFKLYDSENILIAERQGTTYIPPRGLVPIFERTIVTQQREPARSPLFQFINQPTWIKTSNSQIELVVLEKKLFEKDGTTRLEATIRNETVKTVEDIIVTGIVSNKDGNAIAVSQTSINKLGKGESQKVIFTWPELLEKEASQIEIISIIEK